MDAKGVHVDPKKVDKITNFPQPTDITTTKSFLGMVNFYRKFIKGCSRIARPLNELTKTSKKWAWTPACTEAFNTLKKSLTTPPVLVTPDPSKPYIIHCDASDHNIGAVLMQEY